MKTRNILTALMLLFVCAGTCTIISSCSKDDTEENGPSGNNSSGSNSSETGENLDIIVTVTDEGITPKGTIFTAVDDKTFFVNFIKYTVKEGHLEVSGYDETGLKSINGAAKIVSMINYKGIPYQVLEIGKKAFYDCKDLTSVTIFNMVRSIGQSAFSGCSGLSSVTIGNSVTTIGDYAFSACRYLTSVSIGNSVTSIGHSSFSYCRSLTSITIPKSVTSMDNWIFDGCYFMSSSFINNSTLTSPTNWGATLCDIETSDGLLITNNDVVICRLRSTTVEIPNNVTKIRNSAFNGCTMLTSVTIPNSVTTIGRHAFDGCSGLTSITIPNSVTSIESHVFQFCSSLTSIVVESGNTKYDSRNNCNAIIEKETNTLIAGCKNTIIPNNVESITEAAFNGCTGLTSITIPNSVTSIGKSAFMECI